MPFEFAKYEGLGNDFVVVRDVAMNAARARAVCDRHLGVGADGVLVIDDAPSMVVWNADGSQAEMCGNGLRCVAWHQARLQDLQRAIWNTGAGPHEAIVHGPEDVEVFMAVPSFRPEDVPFVGTGPLIEAAVDVASVTCLVTAVGMGNPHAVLFEQCDERLTLGPAIQTASLFPQGVNVGFATSLDDGFVLDVLERGAGWTMACGTGACACAAAAVRTGRWERGRPMKVRLPGGELTITIRGEGKPVSMRGPARHVFDGVFAD
ncbi:MAG: diaminopimelate epimerase [Polyangiales bacterium]